jgi:hypothetical protein
LALLLTIVGSIVLFVFIQNARPYFEFVRGHFYGSVTNSPENTLDRAFSKTGLVILRLAFWPAVLFILLEAGAAYSIFRLIHLEGRFAVARRLLTAFGLSLLTTAAILAPVWTILARSIARVPD